MRASIALLIGALFVLTGCAGTPPDARPEAERQAQRNLTMGVHAFDGGDYLGAAAMFNRALGLYRSLDHTEGTLQSQINLAETALATGNQSLAAKYVAQADSVAARRGVQGYAVRIGVLKGTLLLAEGRPREAIERIDPLLPPFDEEGRPAAKPTATTLSALIVRTRAAFQSEDMAQAFLWTGRLEQSLAQSDGELPLHTARLKRFRAELARRQGKLSSARFELEGALDLYRRASHRPGTAVTLQEKGRLHLEEGEPERARDSLQRALYVQAWIADRFGVATTLRLLAQAHERLGNAEKARASLQWAEAVESKEEVNWKELGRQIDPL